MPETAHEHDDLSSVLEEERELMNFYAPHYRSSTLFNSYYYQEERGRFVDWMLASLQRSVRDTSSLAFLDVGSATGEILELLATRGCTSLTGLDIAERMLSEPIHRRIPGVRLIHGSAEHHDFGDERFDVITSCLTVHHLFDPRAFFELVDRLLRPGGWFFILEYNGGGSGPDRWIRKPIDWLVTPVRRLMKIKNRAVLSSKPPIPALFNHAHRLLRYEDILDAMPRQDDYRITRYTRGLVLPAFNHALIRESSIDAALYELIDALDSVVIPLGLGYLQAVAGERAR